MLDVSDGGGQDSVATWGAASRTTAIIRLRRKVASVSSGGDMAHETREVKTEVNSEQSAARKAIVDLFDRRQEAFDNLDAAMLAADYTDNCTVESPYAGAHVGRVAAEQVFRGWFEAFLDLKMRSKELIIDGDRVAQVFEVEGTDLG